MYISCIYFLLSIYTVIYESKYKKVGVLPI